MGKKKTHFLVGLSLTLHVKVRVFLKGLRKSHWRKKAEKEKWNKPHRCCGQLNPGLFLCERDGQAICFSLKAALFWFPIPHPIYAMHSKNRERGSWWDLRKSSGRWRNWPLRVGSGVTKNAFCFWKLEIFSWCWKYTRYKRAKNLIWSPWLSYKRIGNEEISLPAAGHFLESDEWAESGVTHSPVILFPQNYFNQ